MTVPGRLPALKSCILRTSSSLLMPARLSVAPWLTPSVPWQLAQVAARLRATSDSLACAATGPALIAANAAADDRDGLEIHRFSPFARGAAVGHRHVIAPTTWKFIPKGSRQRNLQRLPSGSRRRRINHSHSAGYEMTSRNPLSAIARVCPALQQRSGQFVLLIFRILEIVFNLLIFCGFFGIATRHFSCHPGNPLLPCPCHEQLPRTVRRLQARAWVPPHPCPPFRPSDPRRTVQ